MTLIQLWLDDRLNSPLVGRSWKPSTPSTISLAVLPILCHSYLFDRIHLLGLIQVIEWAVDVICSIVLSPSRFERRRPCLSTPPPCLDDGPVFLSLFTLTEKKRI